jgi:hypothetical protein
MQCRIDPSGIRTLTPQMRRRVGPEGAGELGFGAEVEVTDAGTAFGGRGKGQASRPVAVHDSFEDGFAVPLRLHPPGHEELGDEHLDDCAVLVASLAADGGHAAGRP